MIPGLATALPQISPDQKTYTLTLRKGLVFSNGQPVKASDFKCTVERMIKVNWGGKSFVTDNVAGATAFDKGQANDISGHHDRRRHRQDHDPARQAVRRLHERAGVPRRWGWSRAGRRMHTLTTDHAAGRRRRT